MSRDLDKGKGVWAWFGVTGSKKADQLENPLYTLPSPDVSVDYKTILGRGSFGLAYEGKYKGKPCAVKFFNAGVDIEEAEVGLLIQHHENIVEVYGFWYGDDEKDKGRVQPAIVMELCSSSLKSFLDGQKKPYNRLTLDSKLTILHQITSAMICLHSQNIVHGDLSAANVLLQIDGPQSSQVLTVKVADFGQARFLKTESLKRLSKTHGRDDIMPPEVLQGKITKLTTQVDVFSFGCLIPYVAYCIYPKPARHGSEFEKRKHYLNDVSETQQRIFLPLMEKCLAGEPYLRETFGNIAGMLARHMKKYVKVKHPEAEEEKREIEVLRSKLLEHTRNIEKLEAKNTAAEATSARLKQENKMLESKLFQKSSDCKKLEAEKAEFGVTTMKLKESMQEENRTVVQKNKQLEAERDKAKQVCTHLEIQIDGQKGDLQASKKECTRLQELVDSLKTDEKKTNAAKEELDRKLHASQEIETSLKAQLGECHQLIARLEEDLKMAASKQHELTVQLKSTAGHLRTSTKECTRLQQLVDSLKTDQKKTNAAKEELDRKLRASQKAETNLKAQLGECHQLTARLEVDLKMADSKRHELTVQLNSTAGHLRTSTKAKEELGRELCASQEVETSLKAQLGECHQLTARLEEDLKMADSKRHELTVQLNSTAGDLQASKKECTRLQELVDSLKADQKKTNAAKEELDRKLCASHEVETSLKDEIKSLKEHEQAKVAAYDSLEKEKKEVIAKLEAVSTEYANFQESIQKEKRAVVEKNRELEAESDQAKQNYGYVKMQVEKLEQNLNKEKQSKKEFLVEFEQLQKRWYSLHRRFTSARNERDQFEKKIEQLESYLLSSEKAVNSLRANLEEARSLMDVQEVALCDRENELSYLSKEMERTKNILAEEQGKYRQLLQQQQLMSEDLTAAEQELKHKSEFWANFRNERSEQEDVLLDLQKCLDEMERSLKLTQAKVEQLQAKLSKTESDNRIFKCDNDALCGQLKSAWEEVQHLRKNLDQNKVKLYDAEESFQRLKNVNMDLVEHEQALQEELKASHAQLMQLREELGCNADTLTKMKESLRHSKEERIQLVNQIKGVIEENKILRIALESKMTSSQLLEEENKRLQNLHVIEDEQQIQLNKQILRQKCEAFEQDMKHFEMMRATLEAERCAFQEERKAHEPRLAQLEEQVRLLHCDLNKAGASLMERTSECVELRAKCDETKEYADLLKEKEKDVQHFKEELTQKEEDLIKLKEDLNKAREDNSELKKELQEQENFSEQKELSLELLQNEYDKLEESLRRRKRECEELAVQLRVHAVERENVGSLAHEAELEKLCWIPFGIQTLTVGEEGGLFPLQPQTTEVYKDNDVITLEVPEGAVNTAVCDRLCIRYGVIVYGPFDLPEGYQLGSMAVYIYFNQDHAVKPVVLHLPHWSGKDDETGLKCVVAPHRLEEGEEKYKFEDVEEGDFQSIKGCHLITIDSHCSLFAAALKEETSLKYYATGHERYDKKGTRLDVVITYASPVWLEILQKYRCTVSHPVLFEFADTHIKGSVSPAGGPGWTSWRDKNFVVKQEDVEFKSHGITSPEHLEMAVEKKAYPPFISCRTDYRRELRDEGQPTRAMLLIEGAKDKPMEFLCTAYSHTLQERDAPIGSNTSPQRQVSKTPTITTGSLDLPSNYLEDSDKDFDTPPSTPPEGQVPIGHSTGSPTSDAQGVPSGVGILGVVETITNWEMLALRLGVPLTHVDECKNDTTLGKSKTFDYWRNGRCDREFPITWDFLLECVEKTCGTRVAEELKKRASENPTWTEK